ncbi:hypothetical protein [Oceanicoccus sp. KOV_DT_Chl]|uniref:hypothetical protein n=1 Tax=Oceanicoccus sp. KOV_DT_Chl TaxID=1904639 RepID=UPI000C7B441E|nr:hypothetical protein [Oceanicoccus sp. KOV_DT_Chl]
MIKKALALIGLILSISTNAAIIDLGSVTRDTGSGLDWLDLTETVGISYNSVTSEFGEGGLFEGYRYATAAEFDQLVTNFGYAPANSDCNLGYKYCDTAITGDSFLVEHMIKTLGDVGKYWYSLGIDLNNRVSSQGAGWAAGMLDQYYQDPATAGYISTARISDKELVSRYNFQPTVDYDDFVVTLNSQATLTTRYAAVGSFLVKDNEFYIAPVPIPSAIWLFSSALIGLAGIKRKK